MTISMETKMMEETSLVQTQELIMSIFSCVGYLRDLFPEDSFHDHRVAGMNLKRFKRGGDKNSDQLLKWIEEGCFDALEKKYLKSAVLTILADTTSPNNVLETYTLRVSYPDSHLHQTIDAATANIAQLSLTRNDKSVLSIESSPSNFKDAISKILRSLCVMSQTLKSLPTKRCLSMKLSYYEEVTPMGYEPPGFVAAEFDIDHLFQGPTNKFAFGKAGTQFHNIGLSMETMYDDSVRPCNTVTAAINSQALVFPESVKNAQKNESIIKSERKGGEEIDPGSPTPYHQDTIINVPDGMDFNESIMIASQVAQAANSPPKFPQSQPQPQPPSLSIHIQKPPGIPIDLSDTQQQQQLQRIKCTCGVNAKDLEMLQCNICMFWQHSVCAGYVSCRDRRLENGSYACYYCHYGTQRNTFNFIHQLSLMRKALAILSSEGFDTCVDFSKRMELSKCRAKKLRDRLVEEKFLICKGQTRYEIAKKDDHIKSRIKYYFNHNLEIHPEFIEARAKDNPNGGLKRKSDEDCAEELKNGLKKEIPIEMIYNTEPFEVSDEQQQNPSNGLNENIMDVEHLLDSAIPPMTPTKANKPSSSVSENITPTASKPITPIPFPPARTTNLTPKSTPPIEAKQSKKRKISMPSSRISCYLNS